MKYIGAQVRPWFILNSVLFFLFFFFSNSSISVSDYTIVIIIIIITTRTIIHHYNNYPLHLNRSVLDIWNPPAEGSGRDWAEAWVVFLSSQQHEQHRSRSGHSWPGWCVRCDLCRSLPLSAHMRSRILAPLNLKTWPTVVLKGNVSPKTIFNLTYCTVAHKCNKWQQ